MMMMPTHDDDDVVSSIKDWSKRQTPWWQYSTFIPWIEYTDILFSLINNVLLSTVTAPDTKTYYIL